MNRPSAVPRPAPRRVRKLPVVAMVVGSLMGLFLFTFLWTVALEMQQKMAPPQPNVTWDSSQGYSGVEADTPVPRVRQF